MALLARLFMASFLLFDGPHVSVAGEVVTVTSTSIATAFSDCTCALTVSDHLTEYKVSTTSVNVAPPFTTEPTRSAFPATSVSYPNWSTTSEPTRPPGNAKRELSVRIPGKCYDPCNDAMLEAESTGKTTDLCPTAAAFITLVRACQSCVASFDLPRNSATVLPQFQQFLFYCDGLHNQTALTAIQSSTSILKATKLTVRNGGSSLNYDSPFLNKSVVRLCGTYFYGTPIFYGTEGDGNCPSNWDAPVLTDVA
ncbi:hypothetical protein PENSUB_4326 [Penicillium subrubescens]|uniref:Uncharacterized protein n=1 Tax=Penicillium subrubescens TaxID=1316194 RepID=A0A1Q5UA61_9EURO|nr:hypothetical protein PENSUB_5295 [Penicillium subrubescens]OKP10258.1 hypothetical protein PENSUB_4326 [Penicillium subrubescens]